MIEIWTDEEYEEQRQKNMLADKDFQEMVDYEEVDYDERDKEVEEMINPGFCDVCSVLCESTRGRYRPDLILCKEHLMFGKVEEDHIWQFVLSEDRLNAVISWHNDRKEVWENKEKYIGKILKYKSQKSGEKDKPRFPTFIGFRNEKDM